MGIESAAGGLLKSLMGGATGLKGVANAAGTIGAMQKNPLAGLGQMGNTMFPDLISSPGTPKDANYAAPNPNQNIPWLFQQLKDPNSFINFLSKL